MVNSEAARTLASDAIRVLDPTLETDFLVIADYIIENPDQVSRPPKVGGKMLEATTQAYWENIAWRFVRGRESQTFAHPATVPDPMVTYILQVHYGIPESRIEEVKREHALSMVAENAVGELLERYISNQMRDSGWIWVSGSLLKAIDFIRRDDSGFSALQIKNRDNSENSSSSAIRAGTDIKKWYRTKSKTGKTMWELFPADPSLKGSLSEEGFRDFVANYKPIQAAAE
jgi:hypothetical protein